MPPNPDELSCNLTEGGSADGGTDGRGMRCLREARDRDRHDQGRARQFREGSLRTTRDRADGGCAQAASRQATQARCIRRRDAEASGAATEDRCGVERASEEDDATQDRRAPESSGLVGLSRGPVHALPDPLDRAGVGETPQRRLDLSADVGVLEGVEVALPQRLVLDPGSVQPLAGLAEDPQHALGRLHQATRSGAITRSAKSSTSSGSWIANGRTQGATISSSTPSSSNAATRSRI